MKVVLKYALWLVAIFYAIQGCFWLLNQKSSAANVIGFLALVSVITFVLMRVISFIKKELNEEL